VRYLTPLAVFAATAVLGACSDRAELPVKADGSEAPPQAAEGPSAELEASERTVDAANAAKNGPIYIDCRTSLNNIGQYKFEIVGGKWKIFAFQTTNNSYVENKILLNLNMGNLGTHDNWNDVSEVTVTDAEINVSFRDGRATINRSTGAMTVTEEYVEAYQTCTAAQNHVQSRQF
jgi:hypothetical protein